MGEISADAKVILAQVGLPDNIGLLLELFGIRTVSDLSTLDAALIEDVENSVKNGTFEAIVDLEDRENRLKYLGYDYKSLNLFKFQPMDTRKLLRVAPLATEALTKLEETTKRVVEVTKSPEPVSINVNVTVVKPESHLDTEPTKLAAETTMRKVHRLLESLEMTSVDLSNFNIEYVKAEPNPILNIACPICKQPLSLQNCGSAHGFSVFNLKRHMMTKHMKRKPATTVDLTKPKRTATKTKSNPTEKQQKEQTVKDLSEFLQLNIKKETIDAEDCENFDTSQHLDDDEAMNFHEVKIEQLDEESEGTEEQDVLEKKKKRIRKPRKRTPKDGKGKKDLDAGLKFSIIDGIKVYECHICNKSGFLKRENIKGHLVSHSTERNEICDHCSLGFKTRSGLRSHIIQVHSENYHYCDLCGMKGKTKSQMRVHMDAVHLAKRNRICHVCGKSFKTSSSLATHMKNHSEIKPEVCEFCGFSAINKGKMRRHMKSHTKERNYQCGICGKMFLYSYNVTAHIKHVHNREKRVTPSEERLTCFICCLRFPTVTKTNEHMKELHGYE